MAPKREPDPATPAGAIRLRLPDGRDYVVLEAPLVMEAGEGRIVTMRTPMGEQADLDWAVGFLATEGVIDQFSNILELDWIGSDPEVDPAPPIADAVRVRLASGHPPEGTTILTRSHEMRASCGICGVESPEAVVRDFAPLGRSGGEVSVADAAALIDRMRAKQPLFRATGGCHGAAIFAPDGEMLAVAEDIGRHNALDRAVGQCLRRGVEVKGTVLALSGRAGYELVVKALRVGIPTIVSVGAASSYAVDLVRAAGARLIGFVREPGDGRVYNP